VRPATVSRGVIAVDERLFQRPVNDDTVATSFSLVPARTALVGTSVRLEPLRPTCHARALYRLGHETEDALQSWNYLPWGPFPAEESFRAQLWDFAGALDKVFYAICDPVTGEAWGMATFLDIQPKMGVIEIGGIWFAPAFKRTRAATEALFLMLSYAMDNLGYRRMQWRCNALNVASRAAAKRLGFRFEGIWYNHLVVKGRNRDTAWYSILDAEWPTIRSAIVAWLDPGNFDDRGLQRTSLSAMIIQGPE
jgi:RimJ/RimL family protein N-acetyltransferase